MGLPILTERLAMRGYAPGDLAQLHTVLYGDPAAMALLGGARDLAGTRAAIERSMRQQHLGGYSFWPVFERETGLLIGEAGLFPLVPEGPDIALGYAFGRDYWGRGYATEAGRWVLAEAFGPLGLDHVVAITREANTRSRKVLGKLGFRLDGRRHLWGAEQLYFILDRDEQPPREPPHRPGWRS
ncbi:MAG: GNAT family N-acetyltransferase [Solirubrobacteraceae bacterium]